MLPSKWKRYSDFYRGSVYQTFPQEHLSSPGKLRYDLIKVQQGPHNFSDPEVPETILALPYRVKQRCTWRWSMAGRRHEEAAEPGRLLVVPSGVQSEWEIDGEREILMLVIPDATVQAVLGQTHGRSIREAFRRLSENSWEDTFLNVLLHRMWSCVSDGAAASRLLSDGLLISALSQLMIKADAPLEADPAVALPRWRLQRVISFVDNNIDRNVSLEELAAAAGLSRRHFARSFRSEVGETPHRWLMERRLEKAKTLLASTEQSLIDIAMSCGFASQSHFSTAMKQATGMSPYHWRQHRRDQITSTRQP